MKRTTIPTFFLILALALSLCVSALAGGDEKEVLTRGKFVSRLFELSGDTEIEAAQYTFDDVPSEGKLAQAVRWASDNGIIKGYGSGRFGPDDPMTREQMVTMLYRNTQVLRQAPAGDWMFPLGFSDTDQVSDWAEEAVEWAVMNRILQGSVSGLQPKGFATDEQLSAVFDRWESFLASKGDRGVLILYTSDVHCGIDKGFGYAGLWEVKNALIAQGYDVILVDDGDSIRGEPIGTITKGETIIDLMNRMGYSFAIPGNHEFDYGLERFLSLTEEADFDYISCNFTYKDELVFKPYVIRELAGKKVAFVGVTTPKTLTSSSPSNFKNEAGEYIYGFLQDTTGEVVYDAVQSAADAARAEGADYVVVMAHLGDKKNGHPWNYADVISHTVGIDVMLDGHSHDTDQVKVKDAEGKEVPRSACGTKLECIGWCHIAADGEISTGLYSWKNETAAPELLGLNNDMNRAVTEATDKLNEKLDEVVATTAVELMVRDPNILDNNGKPVRMIRRTETNLGDLCADAYRDQSGADIAFVNGGGIRTNIKAGDITLGNILSVFPTGDSMCVIEATGQQILDALEWGAHALPDENGGFLQVSGLSYEIRTYIESPCMSNEFGQFQGIEGTRRVQNVQVGGEPIDPDKTYTLASHDFMFLKNGDGYTMFDGTPLLQDCVKLDNQLLIDYIVDTLGGVIGEEYADPYGQGRITFADTPAETRISLFETSDIHGYLLYTSSGKESDFQYRLAYIAQLVNNARVSGKYDDVILLDGGDIYQGMPVSNLTYGSALRAAFDAMDYDAVALGNHEFDWDVTVYAADPDGTVPAYELAEYSGDPDIPVLACNLFFADTNERVPFTKDYVIVEKAGHRIALIGYVEGDFKTTIMAEKIAPYDVNGDLAAFSARVKEINALEKPDITVVLCHAAPIPVAEALDSKDVNLVAGGHKHNGISGVAESGVPYIQCNASAQGYASATLVIGADGSVHVEEPMYTSITTDKTALYDTPENADSLDDAVLAISHAAWEEIGDEMSEALGYIDTSILRKVFLDDGRATSGGNWITGLMLKATESEGSVAAFFNKNGVRANIEIQEGEMQHVVTVGDIYSFAPFNNTWLVYELTGAEIAQQLLNGFINTDYGDQVSGLTYEYVNHGTEEEPDIEIVGITLSDGTEVDINDTETLYRVCTSNYNATVENSVFLGKTPVVPEAEAPIDNLTIIELVRAEAEANNGHILVDTEPRGICLTEYEISDAA